MNVWNVWNVCVTFDNNGMILIRTFSYTYSLFYVYVFALADEQQQATTLSSELFFLSSAQLLFIYIS